jgi:hypothetical protein
MRLMLGPQDAGHAGVATGRGAFSLRSLILSKRPPHFLFDIKIREFDNLMCKLLYGRKRT